MLNLLLSLLLFLPEIFSKLFLLNIPSSKGVQLDPKQWVICKLSPAEILGGPGKDAKTVRSIIEAFSGQTVLPDSLEVKTKDHHISKGKQSIKVREYFNEKSMNNDHAMMYIHGGGWTVCSLDTHDQLCKSFCNILGNRIFSVDYRLAPESQYPIPLQDCFDAWDWLITNHNNLNINIENLSVGGDSAGGHLAATLCHYLNKSNYECFPKSQLLICPVIKPFSTNLSYEEFEEGFYLTARAMHWFSENYVPNNLSKKDSNLWPLEAKDWDKIPPALIVSSGFDVLRDEALEYVEKLEKENVKVVHKHYPDSIHDFPMFSHLPKPNRYTKEFLREYNNFQF